ncbi:unnamed protein product, partial [Meganyctiphanes norvegica]
AHQPGPQITQEFMSSHMLISLVVTFVLLVNVYKCNSDAFHPSMQGRGRFMNMLLASEAAAGSRPRFGNQPIAVGMALSPDEPQGNNNPGSYRRGHRDYVRFGRSVPQNSEGVSRRKRSSPMFMSPAVWARNMDLMKDRQMNMIKAMYESPLEEEEEERGEHIPKTEFLRFG